MLNLWKTKLGGILETFISSNNDKWPCATHVWLPPCRWRWFRRRNWTPGRCTSRCAAASGSSDSASTSSSCRRSHLPAGGCLSATRCQAEGSRWQCTWAALSCPPAERWHASSSWTAEWSAVALQEDRRDTRSKCLFNWERKRSALRIKCLQIG